MRLTIDNKYIKPELRRNKMRSRMLLLAVAAILMAILINGCLSDSQDPEKASWDQAKKSFTVKSLESYLAAYSNGSNAEKANAILQI